MVEAALESFLEVAGKASQFQGMVACKAPAHGRKDQTALATAGRGAAGG